MLVSEYVATYTSDFVELHGRKFRRVMSEVLELLVEIVRLNWKGVKEEFGDVLHLTQLWLYTFGWDGNLWMWCARKFIARQPVWQALYDHAGIPGRACVTENYKRLPKVISRLGKNGISPGKALEAYCVVVGEQDE